MTIIVADTTSGLPRETMARLVEIIEEQCPKSAAAHPCALW